MGISNVSNMGIPALQPQSLIAQIPGMQYQQGNGILGGLSSLLSSIGSMFSGQQMNMNPSANGFANSLPQQFGGGQYGAQQGGIGGFLNSLAGMFRSIGSNPGMLAGAATGGALGAMGFNPNAGGFNPNAMMGNGTNGNMPIAMGMPQNLPPGVAMGYPVNNPYVTGPLNMQTLQGGMPAMSEGRAKELINRDFHLLNGMNGMGGAISRDNLRDALKRGNLPPETAEAAQYLLNNKKAFDRAAQADGKDWGQNVISKKDAAAGAVSSTTTGNETTAARTLAQNFGAINNGGNVSMQNIRNIASGNQPASPELQQACQYYMQYPEKFMKAEDAKAYLQGGTRNKSDGLASLKDFQLIAGMG
jgi:hypothetical protein